jgi:drug/metabolite transporter (DMT)-like permease
VVLVRVGLGAAFLLPAFRRNGGEFPATLAGWTPFFVMGMLNNVIPFSLLIGGQVFITGGMASLLNATTPLFTVLVLGAFGDEKLIARRIAGVIIGLAGVVVLRGPGIGPSENQTIGMLMCLGGALSYGFSGLWGRRKLIGVPPITSSTCQLICSTIVVAIIACAVDRPWTLPMPGLATWGALVGLAALGTSLAYIVFFTILTRSGATNVMLVTLLIPVTAILLGVRPHLSRRRQARIPQGHHRPRYRQGHLAVAGQAHGGDGARWRGLDLADPIEHDAKIEFIARDDARALELIRHDAAHVLAEAVQSLWPGTQVTIGPVIENGFYYDFFRNEPFTPEDFAAIEKKMREIIARDKPFTKEVWSRERPSRCFATRARTSRSNWSTPFPATSRSRSTSRATGSTCAAARI